MVAAAMTKISTFDGRHADGIVGLILPIQVDEFGVAVTIEDQPDLKDIPGFYQQGAGQFWLATEQDESGDERVTGTIALVDIGGGLAALRKMFVASDRRGRPHNTASKLLNVLLEHARNKKLAAVYLGTTDKYHAAHRFYEKNGFERVQVEDLPESFPRMQVDTIFYRLTL